MKKNVMMRMACFLLVAVLISTSAISGTYAKYVTSDTGHDEARVAKFGVEVLIDADSNFSNEYKTHTSVNGDATALSVKSSDDAKVVAPGTSSADVANGGFTFTITGTPEVATRIDIEMTVNHDIYLGANTYEDPTTAKTDSFLLADTYYPVVFTLTSDKAGVVATGNLATIAAAFNAKSAEYAPLTNLNEIYTLTWAWDFDGAQELNGKNFDAATVDAADTLLGNLAADDGYGIADKASYEYDLNIDFDVKITVTQVD